MPTIPCPTCGAPVHRSDALTDAGAEVYCSEACAAKPTSPPTADDLIASLFPSRDGELSNVEMVEIVKVWYARRVADLVAACEAALPGCDETELVDVHGNSVSDIIRAALAKAKGGVS